MTVTTSAPDGPRTTRCGCCAIALPGAEHLLDPPGSPPCWAARSPRTGCGSNASVLIAHRPPAPARPSPIRRPHHPGSNDAGPAVPPAAAPPSAHRRAGALVPTCQDARWTGRVGAAGRLATSGTTSCAARPLRQRVREHQVAHEADPDRGPFLLSGDVSASRLGGEIHRVLRRDRAPAPQVLSYNLAATPCCCSGL